jgi:5-methylcytosine-specific restriction endonuclease McrA
VLMRSCVLTHRSYRARKPAILRRDGFRCRVCGVTARIGESLEVDHIVPRRMGGALRDPDNLRALCGDCNRTKGGQMMSDAEILRRRGLSPPVRIGAGLGPLLYRGPKR